MTSDNFIKGQLAAFAHREGARFGGVDNMLAVAFVIRNRQQAGWLGGNWMEIIYQAEKVAATIYEPTAPNLRETPFRMLLSQIDDVFTGLAVDKMTQGALFYAELAEITNEWFIENITRQPEQHPRVANVGPVTFFG